MKLLKQKDKHTSTFENYSDKLPEPLKKGLVYVVMALAAYGLYTLYTIYIK